MNKNWRGLFLLIDQYQKGTINPIKKQIMDIWYNSLDAGHSGQSELLNEEALPDPNIRDEIWSNIKSGTSIAHEDTSVFVTKRWWQSIYVKLAAACILILVGYNTYKNHYNRASIIAEVPDTVIEDLISTTYDEQPAIINLPDGSTVTLERGSTLYYPRTFKGNHRRVYLKGNGLFNVTPDKDNPFFVYSDHIVTRVVGTSFSIKEKEKGTVEVAVITGIVKVQKNDNQLTSTSPTNEVVLTPNKKVTFYPQTREMVTGIVERPTIIKTMINKPDHHNFDFKDTPLTEIIDLLKVSYGVDIEIAGNGLHNCSITADVSHQTSLFEKLEILTEATGAQFEVIGDIVILSGNGCNNLK